MSLLPTTEKRALAIALSACSVRLLMEVEYDIVPRNGDDERRLAGCRYHRAHGECASACKMRATHECVGSITRVWGTTVKEKLGGRKNIRVRKAFFFFLLTGPAMVPWSCGWRSEGPEPEPRRGGEGASQISIKVLLSIYIKKYQVCDTIYYKYGITYP